MKRFFSILLAVSLILGSLPMSVFAEDTNADPAKTTVTTETTAPAEETEPAETTAPAEETEPAETTAPAEETESAETTAPAEETEPAETTAPAEETEPAETIAPAEETEPAGTEASEAFSEAANSVSEDDPEKHHLEWAVSLDDILDDNDRMLEGYVQEIFYANDKTRIASTGGRDSLNAKERTLYDQLENTIVKVAAGEMFRTKIDNKELTFTTQELGLTTLWSNGYLSNDAQDRIFSHFRNALFAVLEDYPYDCFWISKSEKMEFGFSFTYGGDSVDIIYYFELPVASHYAKIGGEMEDQGKFYVEIDPSATDAASTARKASNYAKQIVADSASMEDWDRLHHYKNVICNLVDYDHSAVKPNDANGSTPWQLINVFDQDPATNVVCEGYSKAFQYLCELTDFNGKIICYQDHGMTYFPGGGYGPHMWNVVDLNGNKLMVDVTNSDSGSIGYDGSLFLQFVEHKKDGFTVRGVYYQGGKYLPDEDKPAEFVPEKNATCGEDGMKAHYVGADGRLFVKENGLPRYVKESDLRIPATGEHVYNNDQDPICNVCGYVREIKGENVPIYRLYNPYTSEHLLCNDVRETNGLLKSGWKMDGIAWYSVTEGKTVYRLYNPFDGSHLYTMDQNEIKNCLKVGWTMDGPVSYSAGSDGMPIYRLFNPYAKAHYHLYSANKTEIDNLTALGWKLEGIAWYAAK